MNMKLDVLKGMKHLFKKMEQPKRLVGELPLELQKEHKRICKDKDRLEEEVQLRMEELALKVKRQLKEEFGDKEEEIQELHGSFWDKVYTHFHLEEDGEYTILANKTVYEYVDEEELEKDTKGLH